MIILIIGIVSCCAWITYDSKEYFEEYFEVKRQKLDLRSESSVDSLKTVITVNIKQIDSLTVEVAKQKEIENNSATNFKQQLDSKNKQIKNLQSIITHQNQMIDNFKRN